MPDQAIASRLTPNVIYLRMNLIVGVTLPTIQTVDSEPEALAPTMLGHSRTSFAESSFTLVRHDASKSRIVFPSTNPALGNPCTVLCKAPRASLLYLFGVVVHLSHGRPSLTHTAAPESEQSGSPAAPE